MKVNLALMGRQWAELAVRHKTEPTTTGNLEHDRHCAQEFLRITGKPPAWYTMERFGKIYEKYSLNRAYEARAVTPNN